MPANVVKTKRDEKIWKRAKAQAKEQGQEKNYAYIMSIYKSMGGSTGKEKKEETLVSHLTDKLKIKESEAKLIETVVKKYVSEKRSSK